MVYRAIRFLEVNGVVATLKRARKVIGRFNTLESQILRNKIVRSNYAYCCLNAAILASKLGHKKMSVIEFGCAGGAGLIALETICEKVSDTTGVEIEIFGFDTGEGLPEPKGYRDLPYHWKEGFYGMEKAKLEAKLTKARIIYGNVEETVQTFTEKYNPAVIGAVFHDLDFYSSTKAALQLFTRDQSNFLPRSFHYFDDVIGSEIELYNNWTGERLAINEFNEENVSRKFDSCHHLITKRVTEVWYHQLKVLHMFDHPQYCDFISATDQQHRI